MYTITQILEAKTKQNSDKNDVDVSLIQNYADKLDKELPSAIRSILSYLVKYSITKKSDIRKIAAATGKDGYKDIADEMNMSAADAKDLVSLLSHAESNGSIDLLPQYMDERTYKNLCAGKMYPEDVTLDLETERGRDAVARRYISLVRKIAYKYRNASSFGFEDLVAAGLEGLNTAINNYHKPDDTVDNTVDDAEAAKAVKKAKQQTFKQYAGYMILYAILNEMHNNSRTVKTNQYQYEKNKREGNAEGNFNTISLDALYSTDDPDEAMSQIDRFLGASEKPNIEGDIDAPRSEEDKYWKKVEKAVDDRFGAKTTKMFNRVFARNGEDEAKMKAVARDMGVSAAFVSAQIQKVIKFLQDNKELRPALAALHDMYTESIMKNNYKNDRKDIVEAFVDDDVYLLLESCTKWNDKDTFKDSLMNVFTEFDKGSIDSISKMLSEDFVYLDDHYNACKDLIVTFLEHMYPTTVFEGKSDMDIMEAFEDVSAAYKTHGITLTE